VSYSTDVFHSSDALADARVQAIISANESAVPRRTADAGAAAGRAAANRSGLLAERKSHTNRAMPAALRSGSSGVAATPTAAVLQPVMASAPVADVK
jgi:hypothetical protein